MHNRLTPLLLAGLLIAPAAWAAQGHDHGHGDAPAQALGLHQGERWPTDAPLRQGMGAILALVNERLPRIHRGEATDHDYGELADGVEAQLGYMFQNCHLDPATDATLHTVLTDAIEGVPVMRGERPEMSRRDGALRVIRTLENYGNYFDHPGWSGLDRH